MSRCDLTDFEWRADLATRRFTVGPRGGDGPVGRRPRGAATGGCERKVAAGDARLRRGLTAIAALDRRTGTSI